VPISSPPQTSEPIFNVPRIITALLVVMGVIHLVRVYALSRQADLEFLFDFAFIPARYEDSILGAGQLPGGAGAKVWSFVTYAFIHADATHIIVNAVWLLAFGSPVARRFGPLRLFVFFLVTAVAGAAAHLATHVGELAPVIGASASISGMMAASIRFVFASGGPLSTFRSRDERAYTAPALPLLQTLRDSRVIAFVAVWFGLNFLMGLGSNPLVADGQTVAWEAHIGGFLAGLLFFRFFDPVQNRPQESLQESLYAHDEDASKRIVRPGSDGGPAD
jgi:membrane associated rhomboid family serine protease